MKKERPSLMSLSCQNPDCQAHQQPNQNNLIICKIYGAEQIRFLRCQTCGFEFSERKNTALWNLKISETRAVQIADCLSDKNSLKATVRITKADKTTVKRLRTQLGKHAKGLHDTLVKGLKCKVVEFDEHSWFCRR